MKITELAWKIFNQSIEDYHNNNSEQINNPYQENQLEHLFYLKNWIDTIQWHLEDLIRNPEIKAQKALKIKRYIDSCNQFRTETVEILDDFFEEKFKNIALKKNAKINTESPAWAIDRLSILALKIFHMKEQIYLPNRSQEHITKCSEKLEILETQSKDLLKSTQELLEDLKIGKKYMKCYKQMKMYNDQELNPILYKYYKK